MSRIYLSHLRSKARRSLQHGLDGRPGNRATPCTITWRNSEGALGQHPCLSLADALFYFYRMPWRAKAEILSPEGKRTHLLFRSRNGTPYAERL